MSQTVSASLILRMVASDRLQIYTTNISKKNPKKQSRLIKNQLQKDMLFYHPFPLKRNYEIHLIRINLKLFLYVWID